ncbi:Cytochrome P450 monooxygenase andK [Penicillium rolfsii]|nr:Cytochrome P450 monooxygenase andK [Penicillium rolfsii]
MSDCLPDPRPGQKYVTVSAINGGEITLPERAFVSPSDEKNSVTVPSLSFLITHPTAEAPDKPTYMLFDLGLRAQLHDYMVEQQAHLQSRVPYRLGPSVSQALSQGGLKPDDINTVILSHIHYDHHGDPAHFPHAQFFVGAGSLALLQDGLGISASHQFFDPNLFQYGLRVSEFPSPDTAPWKQLGPFEAVLDFFGDGSVYVVNAPGHLPGHINLLCRLGPEKWIYLGGDSCHDLRILSGERQIATWVDAHGKNGCIHVDKDCAEETLSRIRRLQRVTGVEVEVVMAHDVHWWEKNQSRAFASKGA